MTMLKLLPYTGALLGIVLLLCLGSFISAFPFVQKHNTLITRVLFFALGLILIYLWQWVTIFVLLVLYATFVVIATIAVAFLLSVVIGFPILVFFYIEARWGILEKTTNSKITELLIGVLLFIMCGIFVASIYTAMPIVEPTIDSLGNHVASWMDWIADAPIGPFHVQ